jgi:hypothetical protein
MAPSRYAGDQLHLVLRRAKDDPGHYDKPEKQLEATSTLPLR